MAVSCRVLMEDSDPANGRTHYGPGSPWQRHRDCGGRLIDPTWSSEPEGAGQALRHQPQDGRQVEAAELGRRPGDRSERSEIDRAVCRGRGHRHRLPPSHVAAAGRLPLCLQATIPHLTRSSLHRCLQRHASAVSCRRTRLPAVTVDKVDRRKFKAYPLGTFPIDIAEVCTEQGKLYLLVAIDRSSKFAFIDLQGMAPRQVAGDFLFFFIDSVTY